MGQVLDVVLFRPGGQVEYMGESLSIAYLVSALRPTYSVEVVDALLQGYDSERAANEINGRSFRVLGVSIGDPETQRPFEVINRLRKENYHLVAGGFYPTLNPEYLLANYAQIDSVCRGEGDRCFRELVDRIFNGDNWKLTPNLSYREKSGIVSNPMMPLVECLDELPFPARDMLPTMIERTGTAYICSSRGCYGSCTFCVPRAINTLAPGPQWRYRTAKNVVSEIASISQTYGVRHFHFIDDEFIGRGVEGKQRALEIAKEILNNGLQISFEFNCRVNDVDADLFRILKQAGLKTVEMGVESGIQRVLDLYHKDTSVDMNRHALRVLAKLGITSRVDFIFFDPYMTLDEVRQNMDFLEEVGQSEWFYFHGIKKLRLLQGTPIWNRAISDKLLSVDDDNEWRFREPAMQAFFDIVKPYLLDAHYFRGVDYDLGNQIRSSFQGGNGLSTEDYISRIIAMSRLREYLGSAIFGLYKLVLNSLANCYPDTDDAVLAARNWWANVRTTVEAILGHVDKAEIIIRRDHTPIQETLRPLRQ